MKGTLGTCFEHIKNFPLPPCRDFPPYALAFSRLVDKYLGYSASKATNNTLEKLTSAAERQNPFQTLKTDPPVQAHHPAKPDQQPKHNKTKIDHNTIHQDNRTPSGCLQYTTNSAKCGSQIRRLAVVQTTCSVEYVAFPCSTHLNNWMGN